MTSYEGLSFASEIIQNNCDLTAYTSHYKFSNCKAMFVSAASQNKKYFCQKQTILTWHTS